MPSVGTISFEGRFYTGRKMQQGEVGGCTPLGDSAWQLLHLAVEEPWSMPGGPFVCFLVQMCAENALFTF